MGQKRNKSDYQEHEFKCRVIKREKYLNEIKRLNSQPSRNFETLTYMDFLQKKISRIENILGINTNTI